MSQSIPAGKSREHVLRMPSDLDTGQDHPSGKPTSYELVHKDLCYESKAWGKMCGLDRLLRKRVRLAEEAVFGSTKD